MEMIVVLGHFYTLCGFLLVVFNLSKRTAGFIVKGSLIPLQVHLTRPLEIFVFSNSNQDAYFNEAFVTSHY